MTSFDAVLKVGGSLSRGQNLAALCQTIGRLGSHHRLLIVPGGYGARTHARHDPAILDFLRSRTGPTASVCTGALLLGKAGVLDGHRATTHWRSLDLLRRLFPAVTVDETLRVVDEGRIVTSAGISAGIDLALAMVTRYHGETVARATARHMEYPFPGDNLRRD